MGDGGGWQFYGQLSHERCGFPPPNGGSLSFHPGELLVFRDISPEGHGGHGALNDYFSLSTIIKPLVSKRNGKNRQKICGILFYCTPLRLFESIMWKVSFNERELSTKKSKMNSQASLHGARLQVQQLWHKTFFVDMVAGLVNITGVFTSS